MDIILALKIPLVLLLATTGMGFWVRRTGKPYSPALFNIHKLLALAGVVLVLLWVIRSELLNSLSLLVGGVLIAAAAGVLSLFATGAVMSIREEETPKVSRLHQGALVLLILSFILAIYLLR
jgi:hypothetical protein